MGPKLSKKQFLETRAEIAALVAHAETTDYPRYNAALHDDPSSAASYSDNSQLFTQAHASPYCPVDVVPLALASSNNAKSSYLPANVPPPPPQHWVTVPSNTFLDPTAQAGHAKLPQLSTFVPPPGSYLPPFNPLSNTAAASPTEYNHSPYVFRCLHSPSPEPVAATATEPDYSLSSFSARDLRSPSPEPLAPASNPYNYSLHASPNLRSPRPQRFACRTVIDLRSPSPEPETPATEIEKEAPPVNLRNLPAR
ncbi:hypothetical protein BDZ45DRAFT_476448 [Acephala macrosclerotiorum]|nr:hypothetical protein BDZ45DRAFT_476448 [Acephala macrosclerotiorum]